MSIALLPTLATDPGRLDTPQKRIGRARGEK